VSDLAFAWQTSTDLAAETVHRLAWWMAAPWSWLAPPPSLDQVVGSQVTLKDGIAALDNGDLVAWWPFICWAMLVYGVLPRVLLAAAAVVGEKLSLGELRFGGSSCARLIATMRTPTIEVDGEPAPPAGSGPDADAADGTWSGAGSCVLLVPEELWSSRSRAEWADVARRAWPAAEAEPMPAHLDDEEDADLLRGLGGLSASTAIVVVAEGWRPCLEAFRFFLGRVREVAGADRPVVVALLGREDGDGGWTTLEEGDLRSWRRRLAGLDDPDLDVVPLGGDRG
jgi:hypothetical protein